MIWDINIRIFHFLLIIFIIFTILTSKLNLLFLHQFFGLSLLGLIIFRIFWGIYGSHYSKFKNFFYSLNDIKLFIKGQDVTKGGHDLPGSISIFSFYFVITVLGVSGLFSSDDILFDGPLSLLTPNLTSFWTKVHNLFHYIIYFLIFIHILAVLTYQFFKKKKIINQMIDGKSRDKKIQNYDFTNLSIYIGFVVLMICTFLPPFILYIIIV